jgi:hypothetical protein
MLRYIKNDYLRRIIMILIIPIVLPIDMICSACIGILEGLADFYVQFIKCWVGE